MDADACFCYFLPNRGSWRQPRSSCVPPPTYHHQRPKSHEQSPSYSWYRNAYFRSFLKQSAQEDVQSHLIQFLTDSVNISMVVYGKSVWDSKPPRKWLILYFCALLYTYPEWCALWKILWIFNVCIGKAFIQCMHWFPLKSFIVELTYRRPFSSVEKLMNLQEGGFGLIFVTNSSMSALLGP